MVYGELSHESITQLFQKISIHRPTPSPITASFLDIGSGTGKMLIAAALLGGGFASIVGIELLQSLHDTALKNVDLFEQIHPNAKRLIKCVQGNALSMQTLPPHRW